jgi:1,4-alpha-glucan branching enzyme
MDSVYGHASRALFPYQYLYDRLGYQDNPFMGPFAEDLFADQGASIDYRRPLVQDFFLAVNEHWLTEFHVDGFRYDCVPNYWDGALGVGYAKLAYRTHELVRDEVTAGGLARFGEADALRLIQCAEQLEDPVGVLWQSCSDCTWQDGTLSAARDTAHGKDGAIASFGNALGLLGFPSEVPMNGAQVRRTALQYVESHDHSRLLTEFGVLQVDEAGNPLFLQGDRRLWFKLQPYLIGLLCAKGIPMLEAGQELGEDFTLPGNGLGRVGLLRPVDWNLFYDDPGRALVRLTRTLLRLRRQRDELRQGDHWYYDDPLHQDAGVMVFRRGLADRATVVAVNFTDRDATVDLVMPGAGTWSEQLHGQDDVVVGSTGETSRLAVPSNYGRVWTHGTAAHEALEKPVTGTDAAKAEAAAVKAVGSGTAGAVTTDVSGNGYEVTVTKSDRSTVEVHLDQSFAVDDHGRLGG